MASQCDCALAAGIDGGGSSFVVSMCDEEGRVLATTRIPTGKPDATVEAIGRVLGEMIGRYPKVRAIGCASLDLSI